MTCFFFVFLLHIARKRREPSAGTLDSMVFPCTSTPASVREMDCPSAIYIKKKKNQLNFKVLGVFFLFYSSSFFVPQVLRNKCAAVKLCTFGSVVGSEKAHGLQPIPGGRFDKTGAFS